MSKFTHFDSDGSPQMVDITQKPATERTAIATGSVFMAPETLTAIEQGNLSKGDVLTVAELAGIMGAKRVSDLIPLSHPLLLTSVSVSCHLDHKRAAVDIVATCRLIHQTGVEMEALTAVSIAALTIYDMCKSIDKEMTIGEVRLLEKQGGSSGTFDHNTPSSPPSAANFGSKDLSSSDRPPSGRRNFRSKDLSSSDRPSSGRRNFRPKGLSYSDRPPSGRRNFRSKDLSSSDRPPSARGNFRAKGLSYSDRPPSARRNSRAKDLSYSDRPPSARGNSRPKDLSYSDRPPSARGNSRPKDLSYSDRPPSARGNSRPKDLSYSDRPPSEKGNSRPKTLTLFSKTKHPKKFSKKRKKP